MMLMICAIGARRDFGLGWEFGSFGFAGCLLGFMGVFCKLSG